MSLLELTVVITVLLSFISLLTLGASAWKAGTDRSQCILVIRNTQVAARSYQNFNGKSVGDPFDINDIIGPGNFLEATPVCPTGAVYSVANAFPNVGTLVLTCPVSGHVPDSGPNTSW